MKVTCLYVCVRARALDEERWKEGEERGRVREAEIDRIYVSHSLTTAVPLC